MHEDYLLAAHKEWIGYVQPVGLLVAPAALVHRGVIPDSNVAELQEQLGEMTRTDENADPVVTDFAEFAMSFLGWEHRDLAGANGGPPLPDNLCANLIEYGERLAPTYAVPASPSGAEAWQMLICVEQSGTEFDAAIADDGKHWAASPHARFERLLRETNVPVGLLTNHHSFRLVYAPKGETSGFAAFDLESMLEVAGRPMLSAFHMLLKVERFIGAQEQTLASLLDESREYQETVSTKLAEQVLIALNELLRGFHAADARMHRGTTADLAKSDPDQLYSGLLTALMRLVFILYAEDRDLFPRSELWEKNYSIGGLFERLRDDEALYPDTMDDRYSAWAQLIALWRIMYFGGRHADLKLIARRGQLFDPDRFPFIEGRTVPDDTSAMPAISDGVVWRILRALMVVDGERLSYRTLDVEQIGSVYQSIMGFTVELTRGTSVAIRPPKRNGAAATIDLESLLAEAPAKRLKWIQQRTDRKLTTKLESTVKSSRTVAELESALSSVVDSRLTPRPLSGGVPVLQPTELRRRTGSHYTPRRLTAPIVAETIRPALERLGANATANEILSLKILDPALGSGAFLVEACRQLAERVTAAWEHHGSVPELPPDEDSLLHARRLVAQRCLYGVDRNHMATDLAKLSLWLATLAKDHEFTFLDHAICHGDALVGLSLNHIEAVDWSASAELPFVSTVVRDHLANAKAERAHIQMSSDGTSESDLKQMLARAEKYLSEVRLIGDALVYAYFGGAKPSDRERARQNVVAAFGFGEVGWPERLGYLVSRTRQPSLDAFHWELQYPEVFLRDDPGFDAVIGNPPYAGKNTLAAGNPEHYIAWLQTIHPGSHGSADLVAHFFRRGFDLLRVGGCLGFIATNTIRQGDTRNTGLRWIRCNGGIIYGAVRRYKWVGEAAVVVSVVHVAKLMYQGPVRLDGRAVDVITAYLFDQGSDDDPAKLSANARLSFKGSEPLSMGVVFDDSDKKGVSLSLAQMNELIAENPKNSERIKPYVGGAQVMSDPLPRNRRFVIEFGEMSLEEASRWPDLLEIVRAKVNAQGKVREGKVKWWRFRRSTPGLYAAIAGMSRVLVKTQVAHRYAFTFWETGAVFDQRLVVLALDSWAAFAVLQSRAHEVWSLFYGSTLEDRPVYTPSDVFETFPFPGNWRTSEVLGDIGRRYFQHRASMMVATNQGLTDTYNRFHNPTEMVPDIQMLRSLHMEMDRAVLDAFGWGDVSAEAVFEQAWIDEEGDGPMLYAWPEETRSDVLTRLFLLNAERARDEERRGVARRAPVRDADYNDESDIDTEEAR